MVAAVAAVAQVAPPVQGIAVVAFAADHLVNADHLAGLDAVIAVQQQDLPDFIIQNQGGVVVLVNVQGRHRAADRRQDRRAIAGGQVDGQLSVGLAVRALGEDEFVIRIAHRGRVGGGDRLGRVRRPGGR